MAERKSLHYRGYIIIAAVLKGKPLAQVYAGKALATDQRFYGTSLDEVCNAARLWIDETRRAQVDARRAPHVGTVEEYVHFLSTHKITEKQQKALIAHAAAPSRILSPEALAERAGWPDFNTTNLQYGLLGKSIADALELTLPPSDGSHPNATYAIANAADPNWRSAPGHFQWQMHDELAAALERLAFR